MSDDSLYPASLDSDIVLDQTAMQSGTGLDMDGTGNWRDSKMMRRLQTGLLAVQTKLGKDGDPNYAKVLGGTVGAAAVANTTSERSLLAATISIPAAYQRLNSIQRLTAYGTLLMNNNTADTVAMKLKVGTVAVVTGIGLPNGASGLSATSRNWILHATIVCSATGATGRLHGIVDWAMSIPTAGDMAALTSGSYHAVGGNFGTVDTTAAQAVDLRATWSAASANDSITCTYAVLESVPCVA